MTTPTERQYLMQLERALATAPLSEKERREILLEVESHLGEARASGAPLLDVVGRFGSAKQLAESYATELMNRPVGLRNTPWLHWIFRIGAALASGVLALVLGASGVCLITGGVLAVAYGIAGPWLPAAWGDLVLRVGLPQVVFVLAGGLAAVVGIVLVRILLLNLNILANIIFDERSPK
jgi:hypothetical protein